MYGFQCLVMCNLILVLPASMSFPSLHACICTHIYIFVHAYTQGGGSSNQLTPVAQESMFFIPPSYEPPPPPPPPNYPAPEISTADLNIGPNLRTIPSSYNADILSGMTSSSAPTSATTDFMSSSPIRRSSAVVNSNSSPHRLCNKQSTLKKHGSLTPSGELADSFEDTFEQTVQPGQWSSFDDMDEDQSYV